jgi:hypothetical protein
LTFVNLRSSGSFQIYYADLGYKSGEGSGDLDIDIWDLRTSKSISTSEISPPPLLEDFLLSSGIVEYCISLKIWLVKLYSSSQ